MREAFEKWLSTRRRVDGVSEWAAWQAAHAKGRAEGLREAQRLINNTDLGSLSGLPEQVWIAQMLSAYSNNIERLIDGEKK